MKKSYRKTRNLFNPKSIKPYRLSRSRLENSINCPRCFYLDRRLGVGPPGIPAYTLNSAVDQLLKNEFDQYRRQKKIHPLMKEAGINAIPFAHAMMDQWREVFQGVQYHHQPTNFIVFGAIDDLWVDEQGQVYVVDYKATSANGPITLDGPYRAAYKRQMEIYQWLLKKQDLEVSNKGYFVYCNGDKNKPTFDSKLEFTIDVLCYEGRTDWVQPTVTAAHQCLLSDRIPDYSDDCSYCNYRKTASEIENNPYHNIPQQQELF